ncbi:MAG: 4-hydroxy-tetrahydrodipicolinate reductase [Victivallaceae bacterium]|nr:4-hydroxy-tetrahydrodipicolinate reductase [Victivallaceae bacterium]
MIKTVVVGAAGRMGRRLTANIAASQTLELYGAVEYAESPFIGTDAGELAGVGKLGVAVTSDLDAALTGADAVIDFATGGVLECVKSAARQGCAAVIGTTALPPEVRAEFAKLAANGARIVAAYNMSVGINLLIKLVHDAASTLGCNYDAEIVEMHHNQKKDAPSGTAVRLAEEICAVRGWDYDKDVRHGREGMVGARSDREIGMHSLRGGDVVGDHTVIFAVNGERIELSHKASSRDTFAKGALRAVEFLAAAKPGLYDMQDVLGLK